MANNKSVPKLNVPKNEDAELDQVAEELEEMANEGHDYGADPLNQPKKSDAEKQLLAEIAKLKKQNAELQKKASRKRGDDYQIVKDACREAAEKGLDPWNIKIEMFVPRRPPSEDPWYWINVNAISVQIPANDQFQELKLPWAECLVDMLKAERNSQEYNDSLQVYDPVTNLHEHDM